ncbi:MAG: hypothetical protein ACTSU2_13935 [Promethearchaeota archaeon]
MDSNEGNENTKENRGENTREDVNSGKTLDEISFLKSRVKLLENENSKIRNDLRLLTEEIKKDELIISKSSENELFKENQKNKKIIENLTKIIDDLQRIIDNQNLTIRSLQESVISSEIYRVPQYQKTIAVQNEIIRKLQDENEKLRSILKENGIPLKNIEENAHNKGEGKS